MCWQCALEQEHGVSHQIRNVHGLWYQRLLAGKRQQPLDQRRTAARGFQGRHHKFANIRIVRVALMQGHQIADHNRQQVVEVVREPTGQLPDGLHFLRMNQRGLGIFEVGDIDRQHKTSCHAPIGIAFRH